MAALCCSAANGNFLMPANKLHLYSITCQVATYLPGTLLYVQRNALVTGSRVDRTVQLGGTKILGPSCLPISVDRGASHAG